MPYQHGAEEKKGPKNVPYVVFYLESCKLTQITTRYYLAKKIATALPIPYLKEVRRIFESYFWTTCSEGRGKRRRRKEQNTFAPPEF